MSDVHPKLNYLYIMVFFAYNYNIFEIDLKGIIFATIIYYQ